MPRRRNHAHPARLRRGRLAQLAPALRRGKSFGARERARARRAKVERARAKAEEAHAKAER
eukprot:9767111-Alexandrium_andersonii.AAC.1